MNFFITGDTHGQFGRFSNLEKDENTAIIILGDVGLNFKLDKHDYWAKRGLVNKYPFTFYCVKGNHEERPSNVPGMKLVYDEEVKGQVWMEDEFPTIKYFQEYGEYEINGLKTLVIGGAYSVDKITRLMYDWPWFPSEQLTTAELKDCFKMAKGKTYDLILTHTCPYSWMPTDLFLNAVSNVDKSMELQFDHIKNKVNWGIWLFGHFHDNRIIRPHAEMLFTSIRELNDIVNRWKNYDEGKGLAWWVHKDYNFYMEDKHPLVEEKDVTD